MKLTLNNDIEETMVKNTQPENKIMISVLFLPAVIVSGHCQHLENYIAGLSGH